MKILIILFSLMLCSCTQYVYMEECEWVEEIRLSQQSKDSMTRVDKERIGEHNINYRKFCLEEDFND